MVTPEIMEVLVDSIAHEVVRQRRRWGEWRRAAESGGERGEDGRTGEWVVSKLSADEEASSANFISGERVDTHPHARQLP